MLIPHAMKRLILGLLAFWLPWAAMASNDPVADVRQIMAGTVSTKSVKQAYLSGARDSTAAFQGALAAYKAIRAAEKPPAPPPASGWVAAPLKAGGYARLKVAGSGAPKPGGYYPKAWTYSEALYRSGAAGDVFKVDANATAYASDNRIVWTLHPRQGVETLYFFGADLEGVAPAP
jgi:hypothetical protein